MHVLVTGVSSFIGSHLARHFLRTGYDVTATYRTRNAAMDPIVADCPTPNLRMVPLDLADQAAYSVLPTAIDIIVHVAAVSAADGVSIDELLACNVAGARNLIRHALSTGVPKFIYASTLSVHGKIKGPLVEEDTPVINPDVYGASKYLAERMLAAVAGQMSAVAIRLPGVLGVGAHRAWLPVLLNKMRANLDVTIFNPETKFNNAAHVDDLGHFIAQLMRRDWEGFFAFPVGAGGMTSVREAVERIRAAVGSSSKILIDPLTKPGFVISSERAVSFGYRPTDINCMLNRYVGESMRQEPPQ
jgi:nucleoside-diphosphate-sugar epimerase